MAPACTGDGYGGRVPDMMRTGDAHGAVRLMVRAVGGGRRAGATEGTPSIPSVGSRGPHFYWKMESFYSGYRVTEKKTDDRIEDSRAKCRSRKSASSAHACMCLCVCLRQPATHPNWGNACVSVEVILSSYWKA